MHLPILQFLQLFFYMLVLNIGPVKWPQFVFCDSCSERVIKPVCNKHLVEMRLLSLLVVEIQIILVVAVRALT